VARAHADGAWVAASCTGAFIPAQAGLLDGGVATTSWWLAPLFRTRFPAVDLHDGLTTTEHCRVLCGGGALAHVDLMLLLLGKFLEHAEVQRVARYLVSPGQGPQSAQARVDEIMIADDLVERFVSYARRKLRQGFSVADAAHAIHTSPRTLERRVKASFGTTPVGLLQRMRAETAIDLLRTTGQPVKWIADRVGYQDENSLRQLLIRITGLTPTAIRRSDRLRG
jgi:transcriptional regulator GlxA family with amidase domain